MNSMTKLVYSLGLALLLTGCGHTLPTSSDQAAFKPEIQIQTSSQLRLLTNSTSTEPWIDHTGAHPLVTFFQSQTWFNNATTTVNLDYPYLAENSPSALAFNQLIRDIVADEVTSFLALASTRAVEFPDYSPSELTIGGDVLQITPTFISVNLAISPYLAGAAHPGLYYRTINFDLSAGQELNPTDIFVNPERDLGLLQDKVLPHLITYLNESIADDVDTFTSDDEWILAGTAPSSTNYRNVALVNEGLYIQFDPYQVAAYALGAPAVTIPYHEVDSILKFGLRQRLGLN